MFVLRFTDVKQTKKWTSCYQFIIHISCFCEIPFVIIVFIASYHQSFQFQVDMFYYSLFTILLNCATSNLILKNIQRNVFCLVFTHGFVRTKKFSNLPQIEKYVFNIVSGLVENMFLKIGPNRTTFLVHTKRFL